MPRGSAPDFAHPIARYWYDLPDLGDLPAGPALTEPLLAEETAHGATRDVVWAYADAFPALVDRSAMADVLPLAFARGALRAAALKSPVEIDGLYHVETRSPEVCRAMGGRVQSFTVSDEACVRALIEHGSAVREVFADCAPFEVEAPFRLRFRSGFDPELRVWFWWWQGTPFVPIARLDLDVWLCWDRSLARACVVKGRDHVIDGRPGPRDVVPEATPPPWAESDARTVSGEGWAATMIDNHSRSEMCVLTDPVRGWCLLYTDAEKPYAARLREAWKANRPLRSVTAGHSDYGALAAIRFEGSTAKFSWLGLERVLRLRGDDLEQLTRDHDLRFAIEAGDAGFTRDMLAIENLPIAAARGLPHHLPDEGSCDVRAGDRFVLVAGVTHDEIERVVGGRDAFAKRLREGSPREVARWLRWTLSVEGFERPVVVIDAGAGVGDGRTRIG